MKLRKTIGLSIGLLVGLSLFGCAGDGDKGTVKTNVNTEQETKNSIANNPHIPPQARAGVMQNMDNAKATALGVAKTSQK